MAALRFRLRRWLRERARSSIAVVIVIAAVAAVVLALAAGAAAPAPLPTATWPRGRRHHRDEQAGAWIAAVLVVGTPLGIATGQVAFRSFATRISGVDDPTIPWLAIGGVLVGLLALGITVAPPVRSPRPARQPCPLLRAE